MSAPLVPPGVPGSVEAKRAVVLAPHYDDEVLGCGGLLSHLAHAGTEVHVVFLSDGCAGDDGAEDRRAYGARRREESAAAAAVLGVCSVEHLDLPDGSLASCLEELRHGFVRCLEERRPDLLLLPSPLEITDDHRAPFAAMCEVLAPLRAGDPLYEPVREIEILLYEVNHPAHPDLLLDVTGERSTLERAMACYASQQEHRDYLAAGLGLRSFRSLTLGRDVELAEAYRRLSSVDVQTRTAAQLIEHLGGAPRLSLITEGPRVSVIVRTRDRPTLLEEALQSLGASTYRNVEAVLVNDGGRAPEVAADFPFPVKRIDFPENRGRAAAANAGIAAAGGECICFLDDDDLLAPEHLEVLVGIARNTGAVVTYSDAAVGIYEPEPESGWACVERRLPYSRDFDRELLLVDNYIPFNTLLSERSLFARVGPFDESLPFFEDWDFLIRLSRHCTFQHVARVTCEYRHFRGASHQVLGVEPSQRPDFLAMKVRILEKHKAARTSASLARVVADLRQEAVDALEQEARLSSSLRRLDGRYHRLNGELEALREDFARQLEALQAHDEEFARLHEEETRLTRDEARLREVLAEQEEHLGRTYAEIERLNGLIDGMKATRAWRLHEWWQRRSS